MTEHLAWEKKSSIESRKQPISQSAWVELSQTTGSLFQYLQSYLTASDADSIPTDPSQERD